MVADHIIKAANVKLIEAVKRNFEEPKAHLQSFGNATTSTHRMLAHLYDILVWQDIRFFMLSNHLNKLYPPVLISLKMLLYGLLLYQ